MRISTDGAVALLKAIAQYMAEIDQMVWFKK